MEQTQAVLGLLLIILVSLALVSAVAIIVLIELGWITRLAAQLYWRWRFSVRPPQVGPGQSDPTGERQDALEPHRQPVAHSNDTLPPDSDAAVRDSGEGSEPPFDKRG